MFRRISKSPQIKDHPFSVLLDLDAGEIGLGSGLSWRSLRKSVVRNLYGYAHRFAGIWRPSRVELDVPRAWSTALDQSSENKRELTELCAWLERSGLTYRVAVTAAKHPRLALY